MRPLLRPSAASDHIPPGGVTLRTAPVPAGSRKSDISPGRVHTSRGGDGSDEVWTNASPRTPGPAAATEHQAAAREVSCTSVASSTKNATTADRARSVADWRRVESLYRQLSTILNDPEQRNAPSDDLTGSLAEQLGRVLAHYFDREDAFLLDLLEIWSEIVGLSGTSSQRYQRLYLDERYDRLAPYQSGAERRRPRPFEASVETVRRLSDLNRIRDVLAPIDIGGILGGSTS